MIVELIGSSSSLSKGRTIFSSMGGSSCLTPSDVVDVSRAEFSTVSGISVSCEICTSSESGLEKRCCKY